MKINSLSTLLEEELKDIYDAEKRLVRAIPKMAKAASSEELKQALQEHLEVTKARSRAWRRFSSSWAGPRKLSRVPA